MKKFEICMDHRNLQYFMTSKKLNRRQARWSLFLSRFDFTLHHRPGCTMGKTDALSRREDHGGSEGENDNITLLPPKLFTIRALEGLTVEEEEREVLKDIRKAMRGGGKEDSVVKAVEELRKGKTKSVQSAEWRETEGLLQFRGKIYVPLDSELRRRIVSQPHDTKIVGHTGRWRP